jgi:hypothetical protein
VGLFEEAGKTVRYAVGNSGRTARLAALMLIAVICYQLML